MRRIDIFVSSPEDVRNERSLVERSIRSIAAEFEVPVTVTYSNWRRSVRTEDKIPVQGKNGSEDGRSWLFPCFWEYEDSNLDKDYQEQIPNTGSYDLVVSILWSRLGTRISSGFVLPDGSPPETANEYEVAWVLDQVKRTPGFPELRVYRNQSLPPAPLEPREERESFFKQWDAVQEFFTRWQRQSAFAEACTCYSDLQEFESFFREHFGDFLARQLQKEVVSRKRFSGSVHWSSAPYQGLQPFEFEQASIFCGRTRAVGEILDALKRQSNAKKPFVLVLGPAGSGKSSLVRAGVLPLLTEVGISAGDGLWRRAITRPGSGITGQDPLDALASALLNEIALPELQQGAPQNGWQNLASELRERPEFVASDAKDVLAQISCEELDRLLRREEDQSHIPGRIEYPELARHRRLRRATPQAQLALVIDHLEDLFTAGFSEETRRQYIAAVSALVRTQRIVVIAILQSEFYGSYQRLSELVSLSGPAGRYDVKPPTRQELGEMVRLPAKAAGLHFERDNKSGRPLDEILIDAAAERMDSLPLLGYVLSQLYQRQLERNDRLLRFTDYQELGGFDRALATRAESAFTSLSNDAQHCFDFVFRHLVALASDGKKISRPSLYKDLIWCPEHDDRRNAGARELVECMLKEGLFSIESESMNVVVMRIADHVLLSSWPRIEHWLIEDQGFVRMRDRVDGCMKLWQQRGYQAHDLLSPGLSLSDGVALISHFHASLSEAQIDYIQKSLAEQKRGRRAKILLGFPMLLALVSLIAAAGIRWFNKETAQANRREYVRLEQKILELAQGKGGGDQGESRQLQEKARIAEQKAEAAVKDRDASAAELKKAQQQIQTVQQNADLDSRERASLNVRVKQTEQQLQNAQTAEELANTQRGAVEVQLKKAQDEALHFQQNADLVAKQKAELEAQVKQIQDKLQSEQQNADVFLAQQASLESQLKQAQDKALEAEQNRPTPAPQNGDLEAQLKRAEEKLQQAQQNTELATSQRADLQSQLKQAQDKLQQAQQSAELAASQRADLQSQLKQAQDRLQQAQQSAELAASQRASLQAELKRAEEKAKLAQKIADLVAGQTHTEENGSARSDASNTGSASGQSRSGRALPLDAGQNPIPQTSTQPLIPPVQSANH